MYIHIYVCVCIYNFLKAYVCVKYESVKSKSFAHVYPGCVGYAGVAQFLLSFLLLFFSYKAILSLN